MSLPNPRTDLMTLAVIDKSHGWNWMMFLQVKLDNQVIIPTRFEHVHEVMKIIFRFWCYNNQHLAIISQESLCTWCTTKTAENEDDHRSSSKTMRKSRYRSERKDLFVDIDNASYSDWFVVPRLIPYGYTVMQSE